jgi:hypothetical protein
MTWGRQLVNALPLREVPRLIEVLRRRDVPRQDVSTIIACRLMIFFCGDVPQVDNNNYSLLLSE